MEPTSTTPPPATVPAPVPQPATVWWRRPKYYGALLAILGVLTSLYPKTAAQFHLSTVVGQDAAIELIGNGISLLGAGIIWLIEQFNKMHPITFTSAAAAIDPNTLAVLDTQTAMKVANVPLAKDLLAQRQALADVNAKS